MSLFHAGVGPALDSNGNPISGARWQFTRTGTTAANAVYADSDLSTSLGSFVASDAAGRFVDIYLDDAVTYRARLWPDATMTGTAIKDIDPVNGANGALNLASYGAVGDDTTDDTAAVQAFVDYLTTNHLYGAAPKGTYKLTAKINYPQTYSWGIIGAGQDATIFKQYTDNVPVFDLGASAVDSMHGYLLSDMQLTYANDQPAANTAANPILFSAMGYQGNLARIRFMRGAYGIKVATGIACPWAQHWDDLRFESGLTIGAVDNTGSFGNTPNNVWGRFAVDAANMAGPIFKNIQAYNWTWQSLEILSVTNAAWISLQALSDLRLGTIKSEVTTYDATVTNNALIFGASTNCSLDIGNVILRGATCVLNPSTATYLFSGSFASLKVGLIDAGASVASTNFYLTSSTVGEVEFGDVVNRTSAFDVPYTNVGGTDAPTYLTIRADINGHLANSKGDADFTIVQGDANIIPLETTYTAPRTGNLPVDLGKLFNGLRYRVYSDGAVNGANTFTLAASGNTKAVIRGPYGYVDVEWRRDPVSPGTAHLGWKVIGSGSVRPGAIPVVPTASLPAAAAAMDGVLLAEDAGAGDRNLILYAGAQRFRIDGGAPF
jgi:hypothetical protein